RKLMPVSIVARSIEISPVRRAGFAGSRIRDPLREGVVAEKAPPGFKGTRMCTSPRSMRQDEAGAAALLDASSKTKPVEPSRRGLFIILTGVIILQRGRKAPPSPWTGARGLPGGRSHAHTAYVHHLTPPPPPSRDANKDYAQCGQQRMAIGSGTSIPGMGGPLILARVHMFMPL